MVRNVVLIILDCVRKDYFDQYASRLREAGDVSFEQCRTASSWSPPSHASIFTGKLPHQHGIHHRSQQFTELDTNDLFWSNLPEYTSIGVNANPAIGKGFGLDTLFDDYQERVVLQGKKRFFNGKARYEMDFEQTGWRRYFEFLKKAFKDEHTLATIGNGIYPEFEEFLENRNIPKLLDDGASPVAKTSIERIKQNDEPFFLFNNFLDAHHNYQNIICYDQDLHSVPNDWMSSVPIDTNIVFNQSTEGHETYVKNRRELYGAAVEYLDRKVSDMIQTIDRITSNETTFIITADHGDNLGYQADNHLVHHKSSLTEALLHVPFVIINPPGDPPSMKQKYFSHLDLGELIKKFTNGNFPDLSRERIPAERIGGYTKEQFKRAVDYSGYELEEDDFEAEQQYWDRMIRCVYEAERKLQWNILDGTYKYAIKHEKPCWQELIEEEITIPDWALEFFDEDMTQYKKSVIQQEREDKEMSDNIKSQLRSLGYI